MHAMRGYNALHGLVLALSSTTLQRLKHTWLKLDADILRAWFALKHWSQDVDKYHATLRELATSSELSPVSCVPVLHHHTTAWNRTCHTMHLSPNFDARLRMLAHVQLIRESDATTLF